MLDYRKVDLIEDLKRDVVWQILRMSGFSVQKFRPKAVVFFLEETSGLERWGFEDTWVGRTRILDGNDIDTFEFIDDLTESHKVIKKVRLSGNLDKDIELIDELEF